MAVAACEEVVGIWHVDHGAAFDTVFVAHVEADVVLDVEFLKAFEFLQGGSKAGHQMRIDTGGVRRRKSWRR